MTYNRHRGTIMIPLGGELRDLIDLRGDVGVNTKHMAAWIGNDGKTRQRFALDEEPMYSSFTKTKTFDPRPPAKIFKDAERAKRRAYREKYMIRGWNHSPKNLARIADRAKAKREEIRLKSIRVKRETMRMGADGRITKRLILKPLPPPDRERRFTRARKPRTPPLATAPGSGFRITPEPMLPTVRFQR